MATRPKYLNLLHIRQPVPAIVSILHRVSGAVLFLALPGLLAWWQCSLTSADTFAASKNFAAMPLVKLMLIGLIWAYLHHMCAGIRHLASDIDLGTELKSARFSSWLVLAVSIVLTLLIGARIW
jgi:succinate dehydrogenase / fumarate reductase cytochrome b subunit